jgi:hypothetical protein
VIRIRKPEQVPAILQERGRQARRRLCRRYDRFPDAYKNGKKSFASRDFDSGIYGAKSVKRALQKAQHGKCAFCPQRDLAADHPLRRPSPARRSGVLHPSGDDRSGGTALHAPRSFQYRPSHEPQR